MSNDYENDYRDGVARLVGASKMVKSGECSREEALEKMDIDTLVENRVRITGGRVVNVQVVRFIYQGIDVGRTELISCVMEETK